MAARIARTQLLFADSDNVARSRGPVGYSHQVFTHCVFGGALHRRCCHSVLLCFPLLGWIRGTGQRHHSPYTADVFLPLCLSTHLWLSQLTKLPYAPSPLHLMGTNVCSVSQAAASRRTTYELVKSSQLLSKAGITDSIDRRGDGRRRGGALTPGSHLLPYFLLSAPTRVSSCPHLPLTPQPTPSSFRPHPQFTHSFIRWTDA